MRREGGGDKLVGAGADDAVGFIEGHDPPERRRVFAAVVLNDLGAALRQVEMGLNAAATLAHAINHADDFAFLGIGQRFGREIADVGMAVLAVIDWNADEGALEFAEKGIFAGEKGVGRIIIEHLEEALFLQAAVFFDEADFFMRAKRGDEAPAVVVNGGGAVVEGDAVAAAIGDGAEIGVDCLGVHVRLFLRQTFGRYADRHREVSHYSLAFSFYTSSSPPEFCPWTIPPPRSKWFRCNVWSI